MCYHYCFYGERQSSVFCKAFPWSAVCSRALCIFLILEKTAVEKRLLSQLCLSEVNSVIPFASELLHDPMKSICKDLQLSHVNEVHWDSKATSLAWRPLVTCYQHHQNIDTPGDNMVLLYLLGVHLLCFCSATRSFAIQRSLLNFIQQILSLLLLLNCMEHP